MNYKSRNDLTCFYEVLADLATMRGLQSVELQPLVNYVNQSWTGNTKTNFAGSALKNHDFLEDSNVIFRIKNSKNGVGMGKFKNTYFEAELLYPYGSKFKVEAVEQGKDGKYYIDFSEA